VLDLAQLEAGALELTATRIDLTDEVRQMLDEFRPQAQQKSIALCLETPDAPVEGNMDRAAFLRIATNLVSNAVKFTREGHVTVTLRPDGDTVEMRVEDTGIGISEGFLNQIFDEFRQESTGAARTHEGSGLGLTITQRLVDLMGGTIAVDSTPGEGSTFTVRLPRYTEKA
jgi:signal transduction histidine kinase